MVEEDEEEHEVDVDIWNFISVYYSVTHLIWRESLGLEYLLKMDICVQRVNLEFQCLKTKGNVFAIISQEFM